MFTFFKAFSAFLWEGVVGKDIRPGKAIKHHKFRVAVFLLGLITLPYSVYITSRYHSYYVAFNQLDALYEAKKAEVKKLSDENARLNKIILDHVEKREKK